MAAEPGLSAEAVRALDWPVEYWSEYSPDYDSSTAFVCGHTEPMSRPDRRCKTGIRTWDEPCHHRFPDWETPREMLAAVAAHIAEAHGTALVDTGTGLEVPGSRKGGSG